MLSDIPLTMQKVTQIFTSVVYATGMQTGRPSTTARTNFGTRVHFLREAAGLSQQEVAVQLGIAQSSYATWERQTPAIRPEQLEVLSEILGASVPDFFSSEIPRLVKHGGPLGRAKRIFEEVSNIPRKKQKRILDVVDDLLMGHGGN